jgi:NADH-quinone oxidoreductase subunit N
VAANPSTGVIFGIVFLICGLAFKVSAAPFHMWTPDVYEGAPTPVVGYFVGAPKLAAMVLLARVLTESFGAQVFQWRQILVAMAILSVAVGAFAGLRQTNLKRLWAYSSIANIGYALVGLAAGGAAGVQSMLIYMALYVVDVTGFFACLMALSRGGKPMETMADFAGLVRERPGLAVAMTVFALSGLGMPPFSGLWGKYYVFKAAMGAGLAPVAVIALVGSVVAAYYYLRLVKVIWLDPTAGPTDAPPIEATTVAYAAALFAFPAVLVALILLDPLAYHAALALIQK